MREKKEFYLYKEINEVFLEMYVIGMGKWRYVDRVN